MVLPRRRLSRLPLTDPPLSLEQRHEWVDARAAGQCLGVSEKTLARWRKAGLFQAGVHWRRKFPSINSPVMYHLQRCNEAMNEATARSAALLEP